MKFLMTAASAAALAALTPAFAQAQTAAVAPGIYGSLGYAHSDLGGDVETGAIQGRLGYRVHPHFGVEGELAGGVKSDHVTVGGTRVKVEQEHSLGAYGVGFLPVSPNTDLLARVGYGNTKMKASAGGTSAADDGDSWNFGVGAQHHFDGQNGVRLDYTRHEFRGGDGKANVWSMAYTRRF